MGEKEATEAKAKPDTENDDDFQAFLGELEQVETKVKVEKTEREFKETSNLSEMYKDDSEEEADAEKEKILEEALQAKEKDDEESTEKKEKLKGKESQDTK